MEEVVHEKVPATLPAPPDKMEEASVSPCVMAEAVGAEEIVGVALLIVPVIPVGKVRKYFEASAPARSAAIETFRLPESDESNIATTFVNDTSSPGETPTKVGVACSVAALFPSVSYTHLTLPTKA